MYKLKRLLSDSIKKYFAFETEGYCIEIYRKQILHSILRVSFLVITIIVFPSAIGGLLGNVPAVFFYDIAIYFVFIYITFSKKISYNGRVLILTYMLFISGIMMLWLLGPQGAGFLWLLSFPVITALLKDKKAVMISLALCFISLLILGIVIWQNWFPVGLLSRFELFAFILTSLSFFAVAVLSAVPINILVTQMEASFSKIQANNIELEKQREKLKTSYSELDRFVYSISHDIRAPLASIMGLIQLSLTESKNSTVQDYLSKMKQSSHRIDAFLHQMIEFTGNKQKINRRETLNLEELCENVLIYEEDFTNDIPINRVYDFELEVIEADAFRIQIILQNLLSNAVKYSLAKKYINIRVSSKLIDGNLELEVEDSGVGIAESQKDKIFAMFYRAHSYSKGSGLGLYLVKECVDVMNGEIKVQSSNEGTIFKITLPEDQFVKL